METTNSRSDARSRLSDIDYNACYEITSATFGVSVALKICMDISIGVQGKFSDADKLSPIPPRVGIQAVNPYSLAFMVMLADKMVRFVSVFEDPYPTLLAAFNTPLVGMVYNAIGWIPKESDILPGSIGAALYDRRVLDELMATWKHYHGI